MRSRIILGAADGEGGARELSLRRFLKAACVGEEPFIQTFCRASTLSGGPPATCSLSLRIASSAPALRPQLPQSPASLCRWPPFLLKQRRRLGCANSALSGFLRLSLRLFGVLVSSLSLSLVGGEQCSRASCLRRYMLVRGSLLEISSAALLLCRHVAVRSHRLYGVSRVCLRFLLRVSIQPSPVQVAESKIA